jgi:DNA-binding response OmpR family regulator
MTTAGYATQSADCVQALLQVLRQQAPDAILLDVELPDGNGFEVLASLRQHPSFALIPILMLTAKREAADIAEGLALGADGYVTKPYGRNTLDYAIRCVMKPEPALTGC